MNVVLLDAETLPVPVPVLPWASSWQAYPATVESDIEARLSGAQVVITNKVPLRRDKLQRLPDLKMICVAASGFDCIDLDACRELGIAVCNVPGYSAQSVAEWVIASIFVLRRRLFESMTLANSSWVGSPVFCRHGALQRDIAGAILGIVGKGAIGKRVAQLATALGMTVIFSERRGAKVVRAGFLPFDEVLARADVLTLHCPLVEETRGMIGAHELAAMPAGAILVNGARGALVEEGALLSSLQQGHLAGAALDVLSTEPPPPDHPLLKAAHSNLLLTPHNSWAATSGAHALVEGIVANLEGYRQGTLVNLLN